MGSWKKPGFSETGSSGSFEPCFVGGSASSSSPDPGLCQIPPSMEAFPCTAWSCSQVADEWQGLYSQKKSCRIAKDEGSASPTELAAWASCPWADEIAKMRLRVDSIMEPSASFAKDVASEACGSAAFTVFLAFEAFSNPFEETLRGCHHNPETLAWTLRSSRSKKAKSWGLQEAQSCSTDSETMAKPRRSQGAREGLGRVLGSGSQRHSSKLVLVLEIWFHSCLWNPIRCQQHTAWIWCILHKFAILLNGPSPNTCADAVKLHPICLLRTEETITLKIQSRLQAPRTRLQWLSCHKQTEISGMRMLVAWCLLTCFYHLCMIEPSKVKQWYKLTHLK